MQTVPLDLFLQFDTYAAILGWLFSAVHSEKNSIRGTVTVPTVPVPVPFPVTQHCCNKQVWYRQSIKYYIYSQWLELEEGCRLAGYADLQNTLRKFHASLASLHHVKN